MATEGIASTHKRPLALLAFYISSAHTFALISPLNFLVPFRFSRSSLPFRYSLSLSHTPLMASLSLTRRLTPPGRRPHIPALDALLVLAIRRGVALPKFSLRNIDGGCIDPSKIRFSRRSVRTGPAFLTLKRYEKRSMLLGRERLP